MIARVSVLGDAGGQGDGDPVALAVDLVVGAGAAQMRGVGEVAPVEVLEAVPLLDEVVAAVVADLARSAGGCALISRMCGAYSTTWPPSATIGSTL